MTEALGWIAEQWAEGLAAAMESMTGERPPCSIKRESGPEEEVLWWRQKIGPAEDTTLWAAAGEDAWLAIGSWILQSAGIETTEPVDARNTWLEVLGQAAGAVVIDIGRRTSSQVFAGDTETGERPPDDAAVLELEIKLSDAPRKAWVAFSPGLLQVLHIEAGSSEDPADGEAASASEEPLERATPKGLELLLDIDLPVRVSFGRAQLPLKDVLKLTTGAIVELNRSISDPVEVIVNNRIIARGEVVVIEGNYGVRIQEIVSRESRIESLP